MRQESFPQELKPITFLRVIGTAQAVPFQNEATNQGPRTEGQ